MASRRRTCSHPARSWPATFFAAAIWRDSACRSARCSAASRGKRQPGMRATEAVGEARRVMEICNACRYCEGFCAVFPAMEQRRDFLTADLDYLANLCHNCKGCYHACQYGPPHEFGIDVPSALAELRTETYGEY